MAVNLERLVHYTPIYEAIDEWGDLVYHVVLRDRTRVFDIRGQVSREEAHRLVCETLLTDIHNGDYLAEEFYPHGTESQRYADYLRRLEDETHGGNCFGGTPASIEAIFDLPQTSIKEGACGVCLEEFETGDKLRKMSCSHSFHEDCIFKWLRLNHVCPLCRFPLPSEQQERNGS